jgi:type I restriction enzyme S subunit
MNATELLAMYERVADAPDAVGKLRRLVLELALRGKLVVQNARDGSASELLMQIAVERARLESSKRVKASKTVAVSDEAPFELPGQWHWSSLAEVGVISPRNLADDDANASFVPMTLISSEYGVVNNHVVRPWRDIKTGYSHFAEGDVGLAKITPCFENGKSTVFQNLTGGLGSGTTELHVVRPILVLPRYVLLFLKSPYFVEGGIPKMTGTAGQKRVPLDYFAGALFPLPPLAEQHRIVAKVDELMALCDQLDAARTEREAARDRLAAASLARLNSPGPETFQSDVRFALDVLPALSARADQVKQLRQTILNLAMRGKLIQQDARDEPASEMLKRFSSERALTREGRDWVAGVEPLGDGPYAIPSGWSWTRISDTVSRVTVGYVGPMSSEYVAQGVPFLRSQNVRPNRFREDGLTFVSAAFHRKIIKSALAPGDVVVVRSGNVGTACVIPESLAEANCSDLVVIQQPVCVCSAFLCFYLNSLASTYIDAGVVGIALTHFNTKSVATMPIPLPPLAEQSRIVAKVDKLMALCDKLEASLTAGKSTRSRLLDALLLEALEPVANVAA